MDIRPLQALSVLAPLALASACSEPAEPVVDPNISYLSDEERLELFDLERADYLLGMALRTFHEGLKHPDDALVESVIAEDFEARLCELPDAAALVAPEGASHASGVLQTTAPVDGAGLLAWTRALHERFRTIEAVKFARYFNSYEIIDGPEAVAHSRGSFRVAGISSAGGPLELTGKFTLRHAGFPRYGEEIAIEDKVIEIADWMYGLELSDVRFVATRATMFEEVTATCGVSTELFHDNWVTRVPTLIFTGGVFLGDVNRDDHLDLLVTEILKATPGLKEVPSTTRLYLGDGQGNFEDSGWRPAPPHTRFKNGMVQPYEPYAAIFDATGNGKVDVLHAGVLWTWNGRTGEMVKLKNASPLPNADATLCDYDRDGLVDVYFVNSGPLAPEAERKENVFFDEDRTNGRKNQLFKNLGHGKFVDVTDEAGASPAYGRTFACAWFHANDDEWPDLFGGNEFGKNVFLVNQGDGTFVETDDVDEVFGGFTMGVSSGDMDGDGRVDLYVSNMYSKAGQRVYSHLDMDKYPEDARRMFVASVTGNRLYSSNGDLTFDDATAYTGGYAVGWGFSGALLDVDLDGWLDVYAPCGYISVDADKPDG